ncbi:MAG TPA: GAF domain-containing SpoIIE family protein phosphatase [Candidatus Baltobacteraceae bacterium]|nr:GAF domain-containing SpoIIE family protein phosphatase [Candidatus Baltobacteraceae bacterium]
MAAAGRYSHDEADGADLRYLLFLVRAGELLGLSLDYHETLQNVCAAAVETVADICLLDLGTGGDVQLVGAAHRTPGMDETLLHAGRFLHAGEGYPRHPVREVIESGVSLLVSNVDEAYISHASTGPEHAAFMRELGYRSLIIVPVISQVQGILGALTLVRTNQSKERYDDRALLFAEDLGRRCGVAISKSKLYSQSVAVASRLQVASLPRTLPSGTGMSLDAYYEPAEAELLIGGDWYDAFNLPDGRIGISVGDVTGHGVDAAASMRSLRDALRAALYGEPQLLRALDIADYLISEEFPEERYATAVLSIFDLQTRTLTCASAGHPGPLLWLPQKGEVVDPFVSRGLPLGMRRFTRTAQETGTLVLEPGSLAVYFTDGLMEWDRDYVAGEAAVYAALLDDSVRNAARPAKALRRAVVQGKHQDDIAVLVLRVQ